MANRENNEEKVNLGIMAKCRKVLPTGRCTKNAVEGRKLCAAHVRIAEKDASKKK
jgi:hypothetical protein